MNAHERTEAAAAFAARELEADVAALDRAEQFDREGWRRCAEFGVLGLPIPRRYGGAELGAVDTLATWIGLGKGCSNNGLLFALGAQLWACEMSILAFGSEAQRQRYLPGLVDGRLIGAHAISEPQAGSDVGGVQTVARKHGDRYLLTGRKIFVTNGPVADVVIVLATLDPARGRRGLTAFLVERSAPGFHLARTVSKMGMRTAAMGELELVDCEVPAEHLLGGEGEGFALFSHGIEWERGMILGFAIGSMERLIARCVAHARRREQFGTPIGRFQAVAHKISEMKLRLEASRGLVRQFAERKDQGRSAVLEAALAKLHVSEAWIQACLDTMQVLGGAGYLTETGIEREVRDVVSSRIFSGTSEVLREVVAQLMGL